MSTALEIGTQLVPKFNNEGGEACVDALYADDVVSIEGQGTEEMPARMEGVDAIRGKNQWWYANNEVHSISATGPFVGHRDDQFVVRFHLDVTPIGGERMQMDEVGLFTVKDGKVAQEEFLYLMG
jgi:limonene-1,2-epoxide hydrolase